MQGCANNYFWILKNPPLNISSTNDGGGEAIHPPPSPIHPQWALYCSCLKPFSLIYYQLSYMPISGNNFECQTTMINFNANDLWARFGHCLQIKLLICSLGLYYWHYTVYVSLKAFTETFLLQFMVNNLPALKIYN